MPGLAKRLCAILAICSVVGCGESDPGPPVEDPRGYAIEQLRTMNLRTWWQAYRDTDAGRLGEIVDEVAAKTRGGLPTTQRRLDRFVNMRLAGRYRSRMEETDEGKAFILARARERFEDPPMTAYGPKNRTALLDFHVLPGEWRSTSRISEGLKSPPAIGDDPFLTPAVIARSLERLVSSYPDATAYQIRYHYHFGSSQRRILMEFVPNRYVVYRMGVNIYFTEEPVAWKDLLSGRLDLGSLEWDSPMEGVSAPSMSRPPADPVTR